MQYGEGGAGSDATEENGEKLFFEYLSRAYFSFMQGLDNFSELEHDLAKSFGECHLSSPLFSETSPQKHAHQMQRIK